MGVKGHHADLVIVDEMSSFADPADLLEDATAGLAARLVEDRGAVLDAFQKAVDRQVALRQQPVACPCCRYGIAVTASSALWGHNCWVCGGWGFLPVGTDRMRGPFAPAPRRKTL